MAAPLLTITIAVGVGCQSQGKRGDESSMSAPLADIQDAVFRVEGMTCASCNLTVKVASERVHGVRSARADATLGRAWVTFDPAMTNPDQIAAAISETGYAATPLAGPAPTAAAPPAAEVDGVASDAACRVLREGVYRLWPQLGRAPRPREIAQALDMKEVDVNRTLDALSSREFPCGRIERASHSDRIVFAWPLSNVPTEYVVKIQESKPVYARCAIDALGVSAMYDKPVDIEATSVSSDSLIRIHMSGSRIEHVEPSVAVVWVAGEGCGCDEIVMFANPDELAEWRRALKKPDGQTLSLQEATAHGVRAFGSRLLP